MSADPFKDSFRVSQSESSETIEHTLCVGRDATLSLGTDSLIVLDEHLSKPITCFGISLPRKSTPTHSIPYFNILWTELTPELNLIITHASPLPSPFYFRLPNSPSKSHVRVSHLEYPLNKTQHSKGQTFVSRLLELSYGASLRPKRLKVLINPHGGQGSAPRWYDRDIAPILAAAHCELDVVTTNHVGHAKEIAQAMDLDAYDVIVCCSGDGTPHEVFNGLAERPDATKALRKIAVAQLPCGSGNAMSINLNGTSSPSIGALCTVKGLRMPMDLVSVTQGSQRYLSFLSQAVGIVAETDLGTDHLRWMGDARFTFGFLTKTLEKMVWPCDIAVKAIDDSKPSIRSHYARTRADALTPPQNSKDIDLLEAAADDKGALPPLRYGSISDRLPEGWELKPYPNLGNFYCGNMAWMAADTNFFPAAMPSDGNLDLVNIDGDVSAFTAIRLLLSVAKGHLFMDPLVNYRKVESYRIIPHDRPGKEGFISIDGERVPFEPFQVEVHRGLGTVLSRNGRGYEAPTTIS